MENIFVNHLIFAGDVFNPSLSHIQRPLNICCDFATDHEIFLNCNKIVGMGVGSGGSGEPRLPLNFEIWYFAVNVLVQKCFR